MQRGFRSSCIKKQDCMEAPTVHQWAKHCIDSGNVKNNFPMNLKLIVPYHEFIMGVFWLNLSKTKKY